MVVPSHDRGQLLLELLASLEEQALPHEVVVVDNGSRDGTRHLVARRFPSVTVVGLPSNVGFARAVNAGVRACGGDTLVLLNNDVVCRAGFLEHLCQALDAPAGVVSAAAVLLQADRPGLIDTAGIEWDATLLAWDHLHGEPVDILEREVRSPLGASGGGAAFDRGAFEAVGGFDEAYFAYLEDVDLAVRLHAAGGRCRLAAGARSVHRHSATLGSGSARKNRLMGWSRGYTIGKYRLHRRPALLARAVAAELAIAAGQIAIDRNAASVPARLAGLRAGLHAPAEPLPEPPHGAREVTIVDALRHRLRRRRRG